MCSQEGNGEIICTFGRFVTLLTIDKENKHEIIGGYIDIDLLKSSSNKSTSQYFDMFTSNKCPFNYSPHSRTPFSFTLIDHMFMRYEPNLRYQVCIDATVRRRII